MCKKNNCKTNEIRKDVKLPCFHLTVDTCRLQRFRRELNDTLYNQIQCYASNDRVYFYFEAKKNVSFYKYKQNDTYIKGPHFYVVHAKIIAIVLVAKKVIDGHNFNNRI